MKYLSITLLILLAFVAITGFNNSRFNTNESTAVFLAENATMEFDSVGYQLLQEKCMTCHSSVGKNHDELIAPPMFAIKRRYSMAFDNRDDFVKGVTDWAKDPKAENAMMPGAVNHFKVMPYMNFDEKELTQIAEFIYDNDMEKPDWFDARHANQGRRGKGMRQGQGMGNRRNKSCN